MLSRDHYAVLGVPPDADEAAIETAFRRLSRRYHPDLNPGDPQAREAFERIRLAYTVLSDSEERARYDRDGAPAADALEHAVTRIRPDGGGGDSYQELFRALTEHAKRARPQRGDDIHATLTVRLVDAERGRRTTAEIRRLVRCRNCNGRGRIESGRAQPCATCRGSGKEAFGHGALSVAVACADCGGGGLHAGSRCTACHGSGRTGTREMVAVQVPAGVTDGQLLRIPGGGHQGARGGPPGDLLVTCRVQADPRFERHGPHLLTSVPVSVSEALLGTRVEMPAIDSGVALLRVPPGSRNGQQLRLRGQGLEMADGRRGDLIAVLELWVPELLDEDAKALIREFGERTGKPHRSPARRATVRR
jgi:molecular chaperone DnaJ